MIIDMHTHCFPDPLAKKAMPMLALRSGNPCPAFDGTASGLRESVISGGADRAAVLNIATNAHQQTKVNDFAISLLGDDVLIPFGSVHFESPDALSELDRLHDAGIKGIKLHPDYQGFFADDERMFPIYEKIGSLGMITVFHAGVDIGVPDPRSLHPADAQKDTSAIRRRARHSRAHGRISALARGGGAARRNGNIYRHRIFVRFGAAVVGKGEHCGVRRGSCSLRLGQSLERDRA